MTDLSDVLAYIGAKIAAQNKAARVGGLSVNPEHQYAAQVLGALAADLAAGLHERGQTALDNATAG